MTEISYPLDLAKQVAEAMGPEWNAQQRDYRTDECAEIVNEDGDAVWMTVYGARDRYVRANERGKVQFSASYNHDLRDHYPYRTDRADTMVSAERGPEAMAKAVLRKVVPTLAATNREARKERDAFIVRREVGRANARRLAEAIGDYDIRDRRPGRQEPSDEFRVGPYDARAEVYRDRVDLELRGVPVDMAERFLREVKAHRDTQTTD